MSLKIWIWFKTFWWIPLLVVVGIIAFVFFGNSSWAINLLKKTIEGYNNQITVIEDLNQKEKEEKEKLQQQYDLIISALETKYAVDNKVLKEEEKEAVKKLVEENKETPEVLTEKLADAFGFKVIK